MSFKLATRATFGHELLRVIAIASDVKPVLPRPPPGPAREIAPKTVSYVVSLASRL